MMCTHFPMLWPFCRNMLQLPRLSSWYSCSTIPQQTNALSLLVADISSSMYQDRYQDWNIKIRNSRSVITRSVSRSKYQDRYRSRYHNSPCCTKSVSRSHLNSEMITIWHWNIVRYWLRALPRSERDGVISLSIILFYHNVYCLAKSNAPKNGICRCCIEWYWYRIIDRYSIDQHRIDRYSIDW